MVRLADTSKTCIQHHETLVECPGCVRPQLSFARDGNIRRSELLLECENALQSFFILIMVQPFFLASSYKACVNVPTLVSGYLMSGSLLCKGG